MIKHSDISEGVLHAKIKNRTLQFGGNTGLKIYGRLDCRSGKRMKRKNRVFFASEEEAIEKGFRPCGHCMKAAYKKWCTLNR